jgi:hypothetical protein
MYRVVSHIPLGETWPAIRAASVMIEGKSYCPGRGSCVVYAFVVFGQTVHISGQVFHPNVPNEPKAYRTTFYPATNSIYYDSLESFLLSQIMG